MPLAAGWRLLFGIRHRTLATPTAIPDRPLDADAEYGIVVLGDDGSDRALAFRARCGSRRD